MGRMKLLDRRINATQVEGYCIVRSVAQKSNIKGSDYLDFVLGDAGGEVVAKLWDYSPEQHGQYVADSVVKVRGSINMWKDAEQLKIDRIRTASPEDGVDMGELVPCAPEDGGAMFERLYAVAGEFKNGDLRMLCQYLLRESREKLTRWPAALKLHHAMRGGLLYHTLTMLKAANALCDVYQELYPVDRELVQAGVMLHDIAKTRELSVGELGLAGAYTAEGQLLGHISLGVAMVERAAAELMIGEDTRMLVQHMLLAHHGAAEYGSPRQPMFMEAEIVSNVDLLDSRLFEMHSALSGVNPGEFSERQWALDNRQLYRLPKME